MLQALTWLLAIEVITLAAAPFAFVAFSRLPDRGLSLAKPFGLLLLGYPLWLLGSLHILPHSTAGIMALIAVMAIAALFLTRWRAPEIRQHLRQHWRVILLTEAVFLVFFVGWVIYRSYDPDITSTEKPMDFAFLNANMAATYFPPEDPWLRGLPISYYYMGYMLWGALAKLTGVASGAAYSLALALVAGMAGAAAFGLSYNLLRLARVTVPRAMVAALSAPALLLLAGNLVGGLEFVRARGWGSDGLWSWIGVKGLAASSNAPSLIPSESWWWWRSSRVIDTLRSGCDAAAPASGCSMDATITEFPFFSFLLGDLHPHVSALPFLLLAVGLSLEVLAGRPLTGRMALGRGIPWLIAAGVSIGALGFLNTWDLPTGLALFGGAALLIAYRTSPGWRPMLRKAAPPIAIVGAIAVLAYLPQYLNLSTQVSGLLPVHPVASRPIHHFLLWGLFLFIAFPLAVLQLRRAVNAGRPRRSRLLLAAAAPLAPFALWVAWQLVASAGAGIIFERLLNLLPWMLLLSAMVYGLLTWAGREGQVGLTGALLVGSLGVLLVIGADLFFIVDVFNSRMNTVFKLSYQAWVFLALASSFGLYYVFERWRPSRFSVSSVGRWLWIAGLAVLVAAALYYPAAALPSKTNGFNSEPILDGLQALARYHPDEVLAIQTLQRIASPGEGIVEAVGGSYTSHGRFAASTGLATVLNWPGHQIQWRGNADPLAGRQEDVALLYTTPDPAEAQRILDKYDVTYVIAGPRERIAYGSEGLAKFALFMEPLFDQGGMKVYRVSQ